MKMGIPLQGSQASVGAILRSIPPRDCHQWVCGESTPKGRCSSVEEIALLRPSNRAPGCSCVEGFGSCGVVPWQTQKLPLPPHKAYPRLERILRPQYSYTAIQNAVQALPDGAVSWKNSVVERNNRVGSWKSQCSCVEEQVKACGSFGVGSWKQVRLKAFKTNPVHNVKAFRELI